MNRAQRRAAHRQKTAPAPSQNTWAAVLTACQPMREEAADETMLRLHEALLDLRNGTTDDDLFDRVAAAINVGIIRAEQIDELCVAPMLAARDALLRCDDIRGKHGRYGFDGLGLQAMAVGLEVYEEMLRQSTPQQMTDAMRLSITRMREHAIATSRALPIPVPPTTNA